MHISVHLENSPCKWLKDANHVHPTVCLPLSLFCIVFSDDIIKYVTLQAAPYRHGGPRPRLSLYLSSQLMYGTVRVYNRQQQYLFCEYKKRIFLFLLTHWAQTKSCGRRFANDIFNVFLRKLLYFLLNFTNPITCISSPALFQIIAWRKQASHYLNQWCHSLLTIPGNAPRLRQNGGYFVNNVAFWKQFEISLLVCSCQ